MKRRFFRVSRPSFPVIRKPSRPSFRVIGKPNFEPERQVASYFHGDEAIALVRAAKQGTGFLVTSDKLMTNHHVLPNAAAARGGSARLGCRRERDGTVSHGTVIELDPDLYFHTNPGLDYTVVGLARSAGATPLDIRTGASVAVDDPIFIVGHPRGRPQEVVRTDNKVLRVDLPLVWYRADTEKKSSGSPVFDRSWRLVAIHHQSAPLGDDAAGNEGVLMTAIAADWA